MISLRTTVAGALALLTVVAMAAPSFARSGSTRTQTPLPYTYTPPAYSYTPPSYSYSPPGAVTPAVPAQ